ncbi:MAG: glycosyltransferase [Bacteroidaceae bacterium]|nr:glycosyltransferase [Bacteroidaceae bacterium]
MIQEVSIILLCYVLLWALVMLRAYGYRRLGLMVAEAEAEPIASELPPMSVIVTTRDQCGLLRRNLPLILEQEYSADFEVIVVDMNSTDDTSLLLENLQERYPHLHVVGVPPSARNISPVRLALTLGIRSANHDWTVLTQADCQPASPHWLARLGQACQRDKATQMVLGLTRFQGCRGWNGIRLRFFRTWQQMLHLPYARRYGAYRCEGTNLCYRRSFFLAHRGFADDSNLLVGATDIMVNHQSTPQNTALCLHPDSFMLKQAPRYVRWWYQERLFFMETRRHFRRRRLYRLFYFRHVLQTWAFTLATLALVAFALSIKPLTLSLLPLVLCPLLWLVHAFYRARWFGVTTRALGERSFTFSLPLLLHLVLLWDIAARLRWRFTKRQTFQKKYI